MPTGRKPKDPDKRVNRVELKHPWEFAPADGWQHGEIPAPPDGMLASSIEAWTQWFSAWWAAFWTPADVPALREVLKDFDQVARGAKDLVKVLPSMDNFGITPKGRTDRRWQPKKKQEPEQQSSGGRRLQVVDSA